MYLRCPWSLLVAIGLTLALIVEVTAKLTAHHYGAETITNGLMIATGVGWLWWGIRATNSANTDQAHRREAEAEVRKIRSQ